MELKKGNAMKKNIYIAKLFILALSIASFSENLDASQRRAAGKRPLNYTGPMNARQTQTPYSSAPLMEKEQINRATQTNPEEEPEEIQNNAQPQEEIQRVSDIKEAQIDRQSLGFFASMYATIAPLILVTLDSAIGKGTAKSTKSLIDDFMDRRTFINTKNEVFQDIEDVYKKQNLPLTQEKKLQLTKTVFKDNKMDFDKLEKENSIASIFATAASTFVVNTAVNVLATFFGYGTKIGLNALMPDQK